MDQTKSEEATKGQIIIYKEHSGPELEVHFEGESVWMTQAQVSSLFQSDRTSVGRHINNIIKSMDCLPNRINGPK